MGPGARGTRARAGRDRRLDGLRALALALLLVWPAAPAAASPPRAGKLVPGKSLGGLRLGATKAQVKRTWGTRFGVCRGCRLETWYFTYRRFRPQGAAVAFRGKRAVALYTLWSPPGWRTTRGLRIGDDVARVTALHGPLLRASCGAYDVLTIPRRRVVTSIYVVGRRIWGFGLSRSARLCP